jgi:hypothetical protein
MIYSRTAERLAVRVRQTGPKLTECFIKFECHVEDVKGLLNGAVAEP